MFDTPEILGALMGAGGTGSVGAVVLLLLRKIVLSYDKKMESLQKSIDHLSETIILLKIDLAKQGSVLESHKISQLAIDVGTCLSRMSNVEKTLDVILRRSPG